LNNGDQHLRSPWNHQAAAGPANPYGWTNGHGWRLPYDNTLASPSATGSAPALSFPTAPPPAHRSGTGIYLLVSMLMAVMLATVAFVAWRHGTTQSHGPRSVAGPSVRPLPPLPPPVVAAPPRAVVAPVAPVASTAPVAVAGTTPVAAASAEVAPVPTPAPPRKRKRKVAPPPPPDDE